MNLDDCSVYLFVRQDIPLAQQLVQSNHALLMMAWPELPVCTIAMDSGAASSIFASSTNVVTLGDHGHPNIILIGVPDVKALERVKAKLERLQIVHYAWREPDEPGLGFTAIATAPLDKPQRNQLHSYRLWKYSGSSEKEHSVSNGEVDGSSPSPSATSLNCT